MRALCVPTCLLLVLALPGCIEEEELDCAIVPKTSNQIMDADTITPGVWDVRADADQIMVWAHNLNKSKSKAEWSLKGLPPGWEVTFDDSSATLEPNGTKQPNGRSYAYPDWGWTMARLKVSPSSRASCAAVTLETGLSSTPITIMVKSPRAAVSQAGDAVNVHYDGRFNDTGEQFDDGEFPTTLGSGQTVVGFDNGLQGLAVGEEAVLVIPPAFAYGYDNVGSYAKFNGRFLRFTVTILSNSGGAA